MNRWGFSELIIMSTVLRIIESLRIEVGGPRHLVHGLARLS